MQYQPVEIQDNHPVVTPLAIIGIVLFIIFAMVVAVIAFLTIAKKEDEENL